jgi:signal transduction histidine kinase
MKCTDSQSRLLSLVKSSQRENRWAVVCILLFLLVSFVWMFFHIGGNNVVSLFSGSIYVIAASIGAGCAFLTVRRAGSDPGLFSPRYQRSWLLIGLALFSDSLAGAYALLLTWQGKTLPVPSPADLGYTLYYPLLFSGMLLQASKANASRVWPQQFLEAGIVTLGLLAVDWYALLGPALARQTWTFSSLPGIITTLSYPFWDILLLFAIVFLLWQKRERSEIPLVLLCCSGLVANIWADTSYAYFVTLEQYTPGSPAIDLFWPLGSFCVGLTALFSYQSHIQAQLAPSTLPTTRKRYQVFTLSGKRSGHIPHWQTVTTACLLMTVVFLMYVSRRATQQPAWIGLILTLSGLIVLLLLILSVLSLEIRKQRQQEQAYYRLEVEHLEEFDRLKDQFMMTVTHEIRSPVMAIQGYLDLLTRYYEQIPAKQLQDTLHKTQHCCSDLVVLLNSVMDQSSQQLDLSLWRVENQCCDLHPIIERVLELIEPQVLAEQRKVQVSLPIRVAVRADPVRLRQILCNLCSNALKYSPKGSPVTITCVLDRGHVIIKVTDRGKGIPPQDQAHLFQRYVRLPQDLGSPTHGSGIGLYISRRLIEAMQGHIWVESSGRPGEGSTFVLQLPGGYETA